MALPPLWALAVALCCSVSFFTVLGFVLQSRALRDVEQRSRYLRFGELVLSPCWVLGMFLQVVPNFLGDVIAYTLAPLSLTAPLSGFSVVVNTSLAPKLLGERLHRWPDLPATALILMGVVLTTSMGPHKDLVHVPGLPALERLATRPLTLALLAALAASLAACAARQRLRRSDIEEESAEFFEAPNLKHLLLPAWLAAGIGGITNIGMKVLGEFFVAGAPGLQVLGALLLGVACPAVLQQQSLNNGLRLYPQTVFFPVYSSLLVLANTILGLIFFEEYAILIRKQQESAIVGFGMGLVIVAMGIVLFSWRRKAPSACAASDLQECLM